ncbi:unnamed protein product [Heterobilharzia americana]|nr:unnamed protein product [Heterobilharzia americana]
MRAVFVNSEILRCWLGNGNTTTSNCSNVGPISSKKDECFDEDCGPNSCSLHTSGTCAISERRQESQTQRPCLGSSANRNPSHGGDGRFNSLNKTSSEIVFAKNCTNMSDSSPNGNQSGHSHRSNNLNKSQPSVSKPSASPRSTKAKSKNQLDSASSEIMSSDQLSSLDGCGRSQQNGRTPTNTGFCSSASARSVEVRQNVNNLSLTGSTNQSKTKVKHPTSGHLERVQLSDARFARFESDSGNSSSSVVIDNASANSQKPLTNSVSKSSNVRSPTKATVLNNPSSAHSAANANIRSSETTFSSVVSNSENDSDQTVEEELKRLTQWCQSRLSSMPMREKVDIPTVVELLATLDAPYEVERMVQTFLGETARTTQFVKDFLDRRRPFWQLHRKRREQACTMQESTCQNPGNQSVNTVRPTEKKKRANPNDCSTSNTQRQNASTCNGLSWTKSDPVHLTNTEQAQDNQWHHIKPKGSHNRKCKKDKST